MTGSAVESTVAEDKKQRRRWWTLGVLSLSLVVIGMDNTILNVAIPTLQREFDATAAQLQWMVDVYIVVFAGLLLTFGGLGDRFGRAKLLRLGLVIFAGAAAAASFSTTEAQVIAARAVMGVGGAMIMPATLSIIIDVFKGPDRARAISVWAATAGIGVGLGPLIGGALLEWFWWGSIFWVNVPIAAVAIIAGIWLVPESKDPHPRKIDYAGAILSTAGVATLIYAIIEAPSRGWTDGLVLAGFAASAVLAVAFVWREVTADSPLLNLDFFRRPRFSAGAGALSMAFFALMGMVFGFTQYLQFVKGYTALEAGERLLPLAAGIAVGSRAGERLNSKIGTKIVVAAGLVLLAIVLASVMLFTPNTSFAVIGTAVFFMSVAMGMVMAPSTDAVMGAVPGRHAGVGSAMNDVTRQVGGAFGVAIIGSILNSVYTSRVSDTVNAMAALPPQVAQAAKDSVGAAVGIAAQLPGGAGAPLAEAARSAFTDAFGFAVLAGSGIAVLAALMVLRFMPAREQPVLDDEPETAGAVVLEPVVDGVAIAN